MRKLKKKVSSTVKQKTNSSPKSLVFQTNGTQRPLRPSRWPEFSAYFRKYIEEDMKNGMLLSVRRNAGLNDDFFYNNAQECSNFKYKSKIREAKMADFVGYHPDVKCIWV